MNSNHANQDHPVGDPTPIVKNLGRIIAFGVLALLLVAGFLAWRNSTSTSDDVNDTQRTEVGP